MERPWLNHYPPGMPHEAEPPRFSNLAAFFDHCAEQYGASIAFENMGVSLTYHQVRDHAKAFGAYLQKTGLKPGDRIIVQLPNILQFPIVFMGAIYAGLIVVPTNPLYTPREMEHQFNDSGAVAIVILSNFAHNLEKVIGKTSIKHVIVTRVGDLLGTLKGTLVNFVIKNIKKVEPSYQLPGAVTLKQALKEGKNDTLQKVDMKGDDLAVLQYTGGTTGVAKGAQLSHHNLISHSQQFSTWLASAFYSDNRDIIITALPLYHIYSLTINFLTGYSGGGKNVLITNPKDILAFIKELKKHKFTAISGVNTLYNALLNNPSFKEVDFSSLRVAGAGAMALQASVAERWKALTGLSITQGYGLSENSGALSSNPLIGENRIDTVGIPIPGTDMAIFDEEGNMLPEGEVGEICARGPQVMRGYWNADNSKVFFHGNWFRTGDMGVMDSKGYFTLVDRKKDMIIVSGLKVFPNEIEHVVSGHSKVFECAVIGVPDPQCGEAVKLFVVRKDPSLTEDELKAFCKENFVKYKLPRYISFVETLPKNPVGKILRRALREPVS